MSKVYVDHWIEQIQALSDQAIEEAVILGFSVSGVHERTQRKLATALKMRRDKLTRAC